nr:MAG TPA: hypothetical protein [Bacteriophage sp.]
MVLGVLEMNSQIIQMKWLTIYLRMIQTGNQILRKQILYLN